MAKPSPFGANPSDLIGALAGKVTIKGDLLSTGVDWVGEAAGQIIAATSVVYQVPLVTRNKAIRHSKRLPFPG